MIDRYARSEMKKIWSDGNRFRLWLEVELAVCDARSDLGLIPKEAAYRIRSHAEFHPDHILEIEEKVKHDVIAFVTDVASSLGEDACYFHEGLTSSDILDTALALQLTDAGRIIRKDLEQIRSIIGNLAWEHRFTVIIGRTHGIHAEPTTFGLKLAVYYEDFKRAIQRLDSAIEEIRTGKISGAVGNFAHMPPQVEEIVCGRLNLNPEPVATQIVQRDRHAAFMASLGLIASIAEKIATEIRHLQRTEVLELEEPFSKGQRGSSAMPHKKNPILCENICGLARLVRSYTIAAFENIALWHERDISHSSVERIILPDATVTLDFLLNRLLQVLSGLVINTGKMSRNIGLSNGLVFSQQALLALTACNMPREQAYTIVQRNALLCWETGESFERLLMDDQEIAKYFSLEQIRSWFDTKPFLQHVEYIMRRAGLVAGSGETRKI
jgi:adenylosuccinate lyase